MSKQNQSIRVRSGMTAVEVLVASLLSALLMVAVMGTMRGLKAHERALELRDATESWQRSFAHILEHDLSNAREMRVSPEFLELRGIKASKDGLAENVWLPVTVRYEIRKTDNQSWLVRSEKQGNSIQTELVCQGVTSLGASQGSASLTANSTTVREQEQPISSGMVVYFLTTNGQPIFQYEYRQL